MARWAAVGVVGQIRDQLRERIRRDMGRSPGAVATVIDSQSFKDAETVGRDSCGAKKINGRKRHLVVDTKGLPLFVMVTPADMTDRDAAKEVLGLDLIAAKRPQSMTAAAGRQVARGGRSVTSPYASRPPRARAASQSHPVYLASSRGS